MDFHETRTPEVDDEILAVLCAVAEAMQPKYIVESGTFLGKSARALAQYGRVDTCDPCEDCWKTNRGFKGLPITAHKCKGIEFIPTEPIDLLFLDSDINTRAEEVKHFGPSMAPKGLMAIDDPGCFDYTCLEGRRYITLPVKHGLVMVT